MQTAVLVYIETVNTISAVEKYSSTLLMSLVITCDFVVPYYHFWIPARYWKLRILEPNACELLIATHCSHWPCPRPIQGLSRGLAVIPLLAVKARKKDCAAHLPLHSMEQRRAGVWELSATEITGCFRSTKKAQKHAYPFRTVLKPKIPHTTVTPKLKPGWWNAFKSTQYKILIPNYWGRNPP